MNITSYPEQELLKIASDFKKHLKEKLPAMMNSSSELDKGFISKFKALFYEVQAHSLQPETDNTVVSRYSQELDAMKEKIRTFFVMFRYYIQKAFPYDVELCESFGYIEMEKVSKDYCELKSFLERTANLVTERKGSLRAANCPDCKFEEISRISEKFNEVHNELLSYIEKRELRISSYQNSIKELFKLMEIVHNAASKSLKDDPESLRHLTFPSPGYIH